MKKLIKICAAASLLVTSAVADITLSEEITEIQAAGALSLTTGGNGYYVQSKTETAYFMYIAGAGNYILIRNASTGESIEGVDTTTFDSITCTAGGSCAIGATTSDNAIVQSFANDTFSLSESVNGYWAKYSETENTNNDNAGQWIFYAPSFGDNGYVLIHETGKTSISTDPNAAMTTDATSFGGTSSITISDGTISFAGSGGTTTPDDDPTEDLSDDPDGPPAIGVDQE